MFSCLLTSEHRQDMYVYRRQIEYFQVHLDMPANKVDMKTSTQKLGTKPVPQTFVWTFTFCWHGISR